jgi:hypothetical protein
MLTVTRLPATIVARRRWIPCAALALLACSEDAPILVDSGRRDVAVDAPSAMDASAMDASAMDASAMDGGDPLDAAPDALPETDAGPADTGASDAGTEGGSPSDAASPSRDARTGCVPGTLTCATADRTRECLDDGGFREAECPAGQVCAEGLGCRACEPGARRCTSNGAGIEECRADGSGFAMMAACDAAAGQVCEGFRCVDLCARAASQRGYLGCEYWPTTLPNPALNRTSFTFAVTIANPNAFAVTATFTGGGLGAPRTVMVPANTTSTETLPWVNTLAAATTSALARGGAYRLVTNAPVAVYQFNPLQFQAGGANSFTNDASLLLPTHVLTGNYSLMTHGAWGFGSTTYGDTGAIVATADRTMVQVQLRAAISGGAGVAAAASGTTQTYMLDRGDVLLLSSATGNASCTAGDLTGSVVTTSAPVAVFGGHQCTQMPCGSVACDHLEEQLFPAETWGQSFVVSGLRERSPTEPSIVRILSRTDGNALTFVGIPRPTQCPATLGAGQYCEFQTVPDFQVSGSAPLLIAQFMLGQGAVPGVGDPAMVLEVPTQQFRTNYVFNVPASYTTNFVTVVYPTSTLPRMDGSPIAAGTPVAGTPYSVSRFTTTPGSHRMTGTLPFGIKVSGTASFTSYMYPGGLDLNQLTAM